ncbi:DUF2946 domain-containing protein [Pseudomonas cavernae]|uniref:DUF2946 domain-containing protein n=1 Tax=Pseudomonas cavernae TaxID=2320867 RepID=A0A385Z1I6_9PSED|nr:DUF2946 family protein [Pseudomonas cavernae]AYC31492.1 DUF2946 domain-containing protein [Pseudomonas cavernae]
MDTHRRHRPQVAWMLYCSVLFGVLACGLGHGQMLGLQLNGIGGLYCTVDNGGGPLRDLSSDSPLSSSLSLSSISSCSLCASLGLGLALLFGMIWLYWPATTPRLARERRIKAPPRYSWPPSSPRAPPL